MAQLMRESIGAFVRDGDAAVAVKLEGAVGEIGTSTEGTFGLFSVLVDLPIPDDIGHQHGQVASSLRLGDVIKVFVHEGAELHAVVEDDFVKVSATGALLNLDGV